MTRDPLLIDRARLLVRVAAVEQNDGIGERAVREHAQQIGLSAPRLGEDDRLFRRSELAGLREADFQRSQQRAALGVLLDRRGQGGEVAQLGDLGFKRAEIGIA